jgi:hypothetical protein
LQILVTDQLYCRAASGAYHRAIEDIISHARSNSKYPRLVQINSSSILFHFWEQLVPAKQWLRTQLQYCSCPVKVAGRHRICRRCKANGDLLWHYILMRHSTTGWGSARPFFHLCRLICRSI